MMNSEWVEFLEKHDRPRGEMDAGLLFGSDAAPNCRVREITQVAYRLNLIRPEVAAVDCRIDNGNDFVGFFIAQMVPSVKKIYGSFSEELKRKFTDVSFIDETPVGHDLLWWRSISYTGEMSQYIARMDHGGIVIVEAILDGDQQAGFEACLYLGHESEAIIDRSECDAVESLLAAGKLVPKTKYTSWLSYASLGGFGVIYV